MSVNISTDDIKNHIISLHLHACAGWDGITPGHLRYGICDALCSKLAEIYTLCLSWNLIPRVFSLGTVIPILKKATNNPNLPESYRPITISTIFSKLMESIMMPTDHACDTQFGFRSNRSTVAACSVLNDISRYYNNRGSPVFVAALDAQKCFDCIWHAGLFHRLKDHMSLVHWRLLFHWYSKLESQIKWQGTYSEIFKVTRGTRQGSLLSPQLFNIFINELLVQLKAASPGVHIGSTKVNNLVYADDVTVISGTTTGLQQLLDICVKYANDWRFVFGISKTQCSILGHHRFKLTPSWSLNGSPVKTVVQSDILGVRFHSSLSSSEHIEHRMSKARNAFFGLSDIGMIHPHVSPQVKGHLWRSICTPTLSYGLECLPITKAQLVKLESFQGKLVKQCLSIGKRSHNTSLLAAMDIPKVAEVISQKHVTLLHNSCKVAGPAMDIHCELLASYFISGQCEPGTLIERVVQAGISPTRAMMSKVRLPNEKQSDGVIDTIKYMLHHCDFIKPDSCERQLVRLLTRCF